MLLHSCDLLEGSFGLEALQGEKTISKLIGKLPKCFYTGLANCQLILERTPSTGIFFPVIVTKDREGDCEIAARDWVSSLILFYLPARPRKNLGFKY